MLPDSRRTRHADSLCVLYHTLLTHHYHHAGRVHQLEQQLRQALQQKQEAELQLHFATEEAQELRLAKETAVVEKEQVAVRSERRSQVHEVREQEGLGL